jgi:trehalose 6-phosphate synthase complex regulatory subunit
MEGASLFHNSISNISESTSSQDLHSHVNTQTAQTFVTSFLNRCVRVHLEHQQRDLAAIDKFSIDLVGPRYRHSQTRLLLLDYEHTLWIRERTAREATHEPPQDVLEILKMLTQDPKNSVWILSGLPIKNCLDKIAAAVPGIGIW